MSINFESIQIEVLNVEIKAIKVGKKQMTQSLFRQLPFKKIIPFENNEILGTPWCSVNYFWENCTPPGNYIGINNKKLAEHIHLVWQQGGTIYRDCIYQGEKYKSEDISILSDKIYDKESSYIQFNNRFIDHVFAYYMLTKLFNLRDDSIDVVYDVYTITVCGPYGKVEKEKSKSIGLNYIIDQYRKGKTVEPQDIKYKLEKFVLDLFPDVGRSIFEIKSFEEVYKTLEDAVKSEYKLCAQIKAELENMEQSKKELQIERFLLYEKILKNLEQFYIAV